MPKLGKNQREMMRSLKQWRFWHPGCGWIWGNQSTTTRILDSLVKRGLVDIETMTTYRNGPHREVYRLNQMGIDTLNTFDRRD